MKLLATLCLIFGSMVAFGQIKFSDETYDNGMRYPVAHFDSKPEIADSMNAVIQEKLVDAETSDFCVGDYGYFQKGNHIELHLICNCIDFAETDHRYLFFSLESGELVGYSDLFENKKKDEALKFINKSIRDAQASNSCAQEFGDMTENLGWNDMIIRLYKDGFEIHPASGACESPVKIPWTSVSSFLKYNFL